MIEFEITNEQKFVVLDILDRQTISIEDYTSALVWKGAVDNISVGWPWRVIQRKGLDGIADPYGKSTVTLSIDQCRVIVAQTLAILKQSLSGLQARALIGVIEAIRAQMPDVI